MRRTRANRPAEEGEGNRAQFVRRSGEPKVHTQQQGRNEEKKRKSKANSRQDKNIANSRQEQSIASSRQEKSIAIRRQKKKQEDL